jgi:hypothetical protein
MTSITHRETTINFMSYFSSDGLRQQEQRELELKLSSDQHCQAEYPERTCPSHHRSAKVPTKPVPDSPTAGLYAWKPKMLEINA